jgi:hypothetical protein
MEDLSDEQRADVEKLVHQVCFRARLERSEGLLPEGQGQNPALTVFYVPSSLEGKLSTEELSDEHLFIRSPLSTFHTKVDKFVPRTQQREMCLPNRKMVDLTRWSSPAVGS